MKYDRVLRSDDGANEPEHRGRPARGDGDLDTWPQRGRDGVGDPLVDGRNVAVGGLPEALDWSAVLRKIWRRKFLLASIVLVGVCGGIAIVARLPSHYVAHALVTIGDPVARSRLVNSSQGGGLVALPDTGAVQTEVEVLRSPQLALEVIRELGLDNHPEFKPPEASSEQPSRWSEVREWLFGARSAKQPVVDGAAELSQTIDNFLGRLRVSITNNSRMVDVAFDTSDPHLSMRIANAIVDRYVTKQLELRLQSAQRTSVWLQNKVTRFQDKVQDAEKAVEQFRAQAGLFSGPDRSPLLLKQLADVSAELATAQTASAAIEARLAQLRAAVRPAGRESPTSDVIDSPFMRTLDGQQAEAEQKLAEASTSMGDKNPVTSGLRERLRKIQTAKRNESLRVVASLEHDLKVARMKEQDLRDRLGRLQDDIAERNRAEIKLRALEREAESDRLVLSNFIGRFKETSQEGDISAQTPDVQIVSYAKLPVSPDRPKRGLLIAVAGVVSLIGGAMVVLLVERADRRLLTAQQVEDRIGVTALGMLPIARAAQLAPSEAARYGTSYREAAKAIYARLFWNAASPAVTLVTSALPGEGKTTLALSLAAMAAQSGQRSLLVDADFWKNGAGAALGIRAGAGLAELLEGKAKLTDAVVSDVASGADIILPGTFSRASLLAWIGKLPELMDTVKKKYDVVIIDGPPVLAVSEATLLAAHANATVLAIQWSSTPCDAVQAALKRLRDAGATVAGAVLTKARDGHEPDYGYTGTAYHSGKLDAYRPARQAIAPTARRPGVRHAGQNGRSSRSEQKASSRYALLVLDVREAISERRKGHAPSPEACDHLIRTINGASRVASDCGIMVLYAHGEQDARGKTAHFNTFVKRGPDAFTNRKLDGFLRKSGVTHLFLAGVDAAMSIKQTGQTALDLGYRVTFIQDAIYTAYESRWEKILRSFESAAAFSIRSGEFAEFATAVRQASEAERQLHEVTLTSSQGPSSPPS